MNHRRARGVVAVLMGIVVGSARAEEGPLAVVEKLIGEWKIEAKWSSGEGLKGRQTYEWGLNRKFIVGKTFVAKEDGSEYQRYETVFGEKEGKLMTFNYTFDGSSSVVEMKVEGQVLKSRREGEGGAKGIVIEQELEIQGKDKLRWQVWLEREGKKEQIMDGVWVRK